MCTRMNEWKIPLLAVGLRCTPYPINLDLEILEKDRKKNNSRIVNGGKLRGKEDSRTPEKMENGEEENGQW